MSSAKNEKYIPALSYDWLTPFYDPVVRLTTREIAFKRALIEQSNVEAVGRVLDLACGTGTLTKLAAEKSVRSDEKGFIKIKLDETGKWYAKFINMVKIDDPKLNYESKWATLTFEIK